MKKIFFLFICGMIAGCSDVSIEKNENIGVWIKTVEHGGHEWIVFKSTSSGDIDTQHSPNCFRCWMKCDSMP